MLKLYSAPESIAMATHIALAESGLSYEVELIDHLARRHFDGRPFTDVNAKGYIPALVLEDGSILTETIATLIYVADHAPDSRLGGADERYRVLEWLSFLTTEIHQRLMRFQQPGCSSEMAAATRGQLIERVGFAARSEEHTSELQSLMRISYACFCLKIKHTHT